VSVHSLQGIWKNSSSEVKAAAAFELVIVTETRAAHNRSDGGNKISDSRLLESFQMRASQSATNSADHFPRRQSRSVWLSHKRCSAHELVIVLCQHSI
jgi:hypothetical protein